MKAPKYDNYKEEKVQAKVSELSENAKGQLWLGNTQYRTQHVDYSAGGSNIEKRPIYPVY